MRSFVGTQYRNYTDIILSTQQITKALIRLRRLIYAFVVRIWQKQVFLWRGSFPDQSPCKICRWGGVGPHKLLGE